MEKKNNSLNTILLVVFGCLITLLLIVLIIVIVMTNRTKEVYIKEQESFSIEEQDNSIQGFENQESILDNSEVIIDEYSFQAYEADMIENGNKINEIAASDIEPKFEFNFCNGEPKIITLNWAKTPQCEVTFSNFTYNVQNYTASGYCVEFLVDVNVEKKFADAMDGGMFDLYLYGKDGEFLEHSTIHFSANSPHSNFTFFLEEGEYSIDIENPYI